MNTTGRTEDPDRLAREIDAQRQEINETLRMLEEKFSSRELASQFMHYLGEPGREWAGNLGSSVKANPLPSLLTAIGVTWLMMSDHHSVPRRYSYATDGTARDHGMFDASTVRDAADAVRDKADALGVRAAQAGERLGEKAAHTQDALKYRAAHAREGLGNSAAALRSNFAHIAREQPLALGAVGIALGALLGAALPRTEHENRMMGNASERVKEKGREMAMEGYDRASEKVAGVAQAAEEALHRDAQDSELHAAATNPPGGANLQPGLVPGAGGSLP